MESLFIQSPTGAMVPLSAVAQIRSGVGPISVAHFGQLLFELLKVGQLSQAELLRLIEFEGSERVASAYAQGKGVLFFTGHFGYWEIQAIAQNRPRCRDPSARSASLKITEANATSKPKVTRWLFP